MLIIKYISLFLIIITCSYIGILISKKYVDRENELKEMKKALNMFETKLKFTYEPLTDIFFDISEKTEKSISNMFKLASVYLKNEPATISWKKSINNVNTSFTKEDICTIEGLGKLLGKTDIQGQLNQIQLVNTFLDAQIEQAKDERNKNEKMYKTLGMIAGLMIFLIFV